MKKSTLLKAACGLLAAVGIGYLVKKEYQKQYNKLGPSEDEEEKEEQQSQEASEPETPETDSLEEDDLEDISLLERVIGTLYDESIVDDEILESYDKVVNRQSQSQIELNILEGKYEWNPWFEILIRVPKPTDHLNYKNFQTALINYINWFSKKGEMYEDRVNVKKIYQKAFYTYVKEGATERHYDVVDVNSEDSEVKEFAKKDENGKPILSTALPAFFKSYYEHPEYYCIPKNKSTFENYIGFRYNFDDNYDVESEVRIFVDFIKEIFSTDFLRIHSDRDDRCLGGVEINILACHPEEDMGKIYKISKGRIVGEVSAQ